ncbi:MAG: TraR/DksA family transcriptional regulator [Acidimicrobiales bacterium]
MPRTLDAAVAKCRVTGTLRRGASPSAQGHTEKGAIDMAISRKERSGATKEAANSVKSTVTGKPGAVEKKATRPSAVSSSSKRVVKEEAKDVNRRPAGQAPQGASRARAKPVATVPAKLSSVPMAKTASRAPTRSATKGALPVSVKGKVTASISPAGSAKGAAKPGAKGAAKPGAKGTAKPGAKGAAKPGAKGAAKPGAKGAAKPGAKGAAKPGLEEAGKSPASGKPSSPVRHTARTAAKPAGKLSGNIASKTTLPARLPGESRVPSGEHSTKMISYESDVKFLEEMREALLKERTIYKEQVEMLKSEAESLAMEREPGDVQFDEESGEGGTASLERELDLSLSAQAIEAIHLIDDALAGIDNGTYGMCDSCHRPISRARLRALPYVRLCIECKSGGLHRH